MTEGRPMLRDLLIEQRLKCDATGEDLCELRVEESENRTGAPNVPAQGRLRVFFAYDASRGAPRQITSTEARLVARSLEMLADHIDRWEEATRRARLK